MKIILTSHAGNALGKHHNLSPYQTGSLLAFFLESVFRFSGERSLLLLLDISPSSSTSTSSPSSTMSPGATGSISNITVLGTRKDALIMSLLGATFLTKDTSSRW